MKRPFVVEGQVGEQTDQIVQNVSDYSRRDANQCRQQRNEAKSIACRTLRRQGRGSFHGNCQVHLLLTMGAANDLLQRREQLRAGGLQLFMMRG